MADLTYTAKFGVYVLLDSTSCLRLVWDLTQNTFVQIHALLLGLVIEHSTITRRAWIRFPACVPGKRPIRVETKAGVADLMVVDRLPNTEKSDKNMNVVITFPAHLLMRKGIKI